MNSSIDLPLKTLSTISLTYDQAKKNINKFILNLTMFKV